MTDPVAHPEPVRESLAHPEPITTPGGREVAPGGWRRAMTGVLVGIGAGALHRFARALDESRRADAHVGRSGRRRP